MTSTDPGEGSPKPVSSDGGESQQQLVRELEEIAAKQLKRTDDETVILFDAEHPENETNTIEVDKDKLAIERNITELQQRVMNAMVDFSRRIALINTEARGEEDLAIDVQFTKTIQAIRERIIDRVPDLADQCWRIGDKAREGELDSMKRLDGLINEARMALIDSADMTTERLKKAMEVAVDDASGERIDSMVREASGKLVDGMKYVEGRLSKVPGYYGEVEAQLDEMVSAYKRLLDTTNKPLSNDEQDEFSQFLEERRKAFITQLEAKVKLERERVSNIAGAMREYYSKDYQPTIDRTHADLRAL